MCVCVARSKIVIRMPHMQILGSNTIPHHQEAGLLVEMAYSRAGGEKVQSELKTSCFAIRLKSVKKRMMETRHEDTRARLKGLSLAKSRTI